MVTINQSYQKDNSLQASESEKLEKPGNYSNSKPNCWTLTLVVSSRIAFLDRIFIPPPNSASLKGPPIGQANYDPIEGSYNRLPFPGDPNAMARPGDVRIPPTGNFPGDQPPPGIPAQPGQTIGKCSEPWDAIRPTTSRREVRFLVTILVFFESCFKIVTFREWSEIIVSSNFATTWPVAKMHCCRGSEMPETLEQHRISRDVCVGEWPSRTRNPSLVSPNLPSSLPSFSSLYFYYDCLSKLVIQYCRDASPMVVNLVMPENRRREMAINCRTYTRDQCNKGARINFNMNSILLLFIVTVFVYIKSITLWAAFHSIIAINSHIQCWTSRLPRLLQLFSTFLFSPLIIISEHCRISTGSEI